MGPVPPGTRQWTHRLVFLEAMGQQHLLRKGRGHTRNNSIVGSPIPTRAATQKPSPPTEPTSPQKIESPAKQETVKNLSENTLAAAEDLKAKEDSEDTVEAVKDAEATIVCSE